MLRILLKAMVLLCCIFICLMTFMLSLGMAAPDVSKIAFFSQEISGSQYWRLDLFTGVAFKDSYEGRIFIPANEENNVNHFLAVSSDANYHSVSEVNLYNRSESYVMRYPSRSYDLLLVGDFALTVDSANLWRRTDILNSDVSGLGRYSNMSLPEASPDGKWVAGRIYNDNWLFVNVLDGRSYEIGRYVYMNWSPDAQRYLVGDYGHVSVLDADDGSFDPAFARRIPARWARWSEDGQYLVLEKDNRLSMISVTGEQQDFSFSYGFYWLQCLSPDNRFILSFGGGQLHLLEVATGQNHWNFDSESGAVNCSWSADGRYLFFYLRTTVDEEERFFLVDTRTYASWDLYPSSLPSEPSYLHIPD